MYNSQDKKDLFIFLLRSLRVFALGIVFLCCTTGGVWSQEASSDQDPKTGYIQYNFNKVPSIKIAPRGNISGQTCKVIGTKPEGALRYNTALKNIEFCDGEDWRVIGDSLNALSCNANNKGVMRYNDTIDNLQYCDGTEWKGMGTIPDDTACNASLRGTTRFIPANTHLEYCDGSSWTKVSGTRLVIDYPNCEGVWYPARWPTQTFPDYRPTYKARGAPDSGGVQVSKMDVVCPPDKIIISTDDNTMSYAYCCPLKIE